MADWPVFFFFRSFALKDYQADLAWKSIPLAMFVTQRGLLYAVPAGLAPAASLANHAARAAPERGIPALGGMVALLHHAAVPSAHFSLSRLSFCSGGSCSEIRTGEVISSVCSALTRFPPRFSFTLSPDSPKLERSAGNSDWMADPKKPPWWFWLQNFGLFLPACLALLIYLFDSCQAAGARCEAKIAAALLSRRGRLYRLFASLNLLPGNGTIPSSFSGPISS